MEPLLLAVSPTVLMIGIAGVSTALLRRRLEYRTLARADYRPGRTYAAPIAEAPLTTRFPGDQLGPDELI